MEIIFLQDGDLEILRWRKEFPFSEGDYKLERGYAILQDNIKTVDHFMVVADGKRRYKLFSFSETDQMAPRRITSATPFEGSFALESDIEHRLFEYLKEGYEQKLLDSDQFLDYARKIDTSISEFNRRKHISYGIGSAFLVASSGLGLYYTARAFNLDPDPTTTYCTTLICSATAGFLRNVITIKDAKREIRREAEAASTEMHNLLYDLESRLRT